jgi:hypothetical protein
MRYRREIYTYDKINKRINRYGEESEYSDIIWYGLIQAPQRVNEVVTKKPGGHDEIFDFSPLPDRKFVFIMRWSRESGWDLPIYYFDSDKKSLEKLADNIWPVEGENPVPRINSISGDSTNMAFDMYSCWNCGAGFPEIKLINIKTKTTRNLGIVLEFKWTGNNTYTYKEFIEKTCTGPYECHEEPENLPLKYGSFQ